MKNYRLIVEQRPKTQLDIAIESGSDFSFVFGSERELVDGGRFDKFHDDDILSAKFFVEFGDFDFFSTLNFAIDIVCKSLISFNIGLLVEKIGFLFNPFKVEIERVVTASKVAKFDKLAKTMGKLANSLQVTVDGFGNVLAFDLDGDRLTGLKNGAVDLRNGGRADRGFINLGENFFKSVAIFTAQNRHNLYKTNRVTIVTNAGEQKAILFREQVAKVLGGEHLGHFDVDNAHALGEAADELAVWATEEKFGEKEFEEFEVEFHIVGL